MDRLTELETKMGALTFELWEMCKGHNAFVVIGAGMNVVTTAAQTIPDRALLEGLAMGLREIAQKIETQARGVTQ